VARMITSKKLDSRTARRSIAAGKVTHWIPISRGRSLGYRRGLRGGTWVARFYGENLRREMKLGEADDVLDSDGVQILDFSQALDKANKFFHSALSEATGEHPTRRGGYSVADCIHDYLKHLERRDAPDHSHAKYDFNAYVIPKLGDFQVSKLSLARLEAWRAEIANSPKRSQKKPKEGVISEPPKPLTDDERRRRRSTANRIMRRVKAALNLALDTGRVHANPINWRVRPFENVESPRAEFLTEKQQREFIAACLSEPDFQDLVLAALHIGSRLGELARLQVRDFVSSSNTIYIEKSKSGKPRHIFLDDEGIRFCKRLTADRKPDEILLLRSNGKSWTKDAVKKPMRRACKKVGRKGLGFHQLRHSFATRLLTRGVPMKIVADQMGHSSARMLEKHYAHIQDSHVQQLIAALPSAGLNQAARPKRARVLTLPAKRSA
jgi:integrase